MRSSPRRGRPGTQRILRAQAFSPRLPAARATDPASRTALESSNVIGCERLPGAAADPRPAPTTANDLAAESSHRGAQGERRRRVADLALHAVPEEPNKRSSIPAGAPRATAPGERRYPTAWAYVQARGHTVAPAEHAQARGGQESGTCQQEDGSGRTGACARQLVLSGIRSRPVIARKNGLP